MDDAKKFEFYTKQAENSIKTRAPTLYSSYFVVNVAYNYIIVILAFTIYLTVIILLPRTLINALSQTLILVLLCVYLSCGIKTLLRYWNLLIFYQAFVLMILVIYQFLVQTPNFEDSWLYKTVEKLPDVWTKWVRWAGFEKFDDPIWVHLLPYVVFFSLSVILLTNFRKKDEMENNKLQTMEDFTATFIQAGRITNR